MSMKWKIAWIGNSRGVRVYFSVAQERCMKESIKKWMSIAVLGCQGLIFSYDSSWRDLRSPEGFAVSMQVGGYDYREPGLMKQEGGLAGFGVDWACRAFEENYVRLQVGYNQGHVDYTGSGTLDDKPVKKLETRLIWGNDDITLGQGRLMRYTGLGFRQLYNDARGETSTGKFGYRRYNDMIYLPIGVEYCVQVGEYLTLWNMEMDLLLVGRQRSLLQDAGPDYSELSNDQHGGVGFRLNAMMEFGGIWFGPYLEYWDINDSQVVQSGDFIGVEPANNTVEYGFQIKYFF